MYDEKTKRKNDELLNDESRSDLWTYILILAIVFVMAIWILELMGPAIGNIFSNIIIMCDFGAGV